MSVVTIRSPLVILSDLQVGCARSFLAHRGLPLPRIHEAELKFPGKSCLIPLNAWIRKFTTPAEKGCISASLPNIYLSVKDPNNSPNKIYFFPALHPLTYFKNPHKTSTSSSASSSRNRAIFYSARQCLSEDD